MWWQMGHWVLVVNKSVIVWCFLVRKSCEFLIAYAWLAEIVHCDVEAIFDKVQLGEESQSTTKAVASGLNLVGGEKLFESLNLS